MSAVLPSFHLCLVDGDRKDWLARSLSEAGAHVTTADPGRPAAGSVAACIALAPVIPDEAGDWDQVEAALAQCFAHAQAYAQRLTDMDEARSGAIIALLPATATMGDPRQPLSSALAGGMLSLFRTWTLELKAKGISVNSIFIPEDPDDADAEAITGLLLLLAGQAGATITGQEIFAARGMDAGRLRP